MDAPIGGKSKRQNQQAQAKAQAEAKKKAEAESSSSQSTVKISFQEILGLLESLIKDWSRDGGKIIGDVIDQKERALYNIGLPTDHHLDFSYDELIDHIISKDLDYFALPNLKKAFKHIAKNGIMKVPISKHAKAGALGKRVTKSLELYQDVDASFIQKRLDRYPVALVLEINPVFSFLQKDIYYLPKKETITEKTRLHIILLFGYGRTKEGELYFIGQNSYGEGWGCKGYAQIIIREKCDIVCLKEEV